MRVILTHHIAHRPRRFAIGLVVGIASLVHRKQDAPVDRFQPITQIWNGARDDNRHGIIQIGRAHLMFDGDRRAIVHGPLWPVFFFVIRCFWRVAHVEYSAFIRN